MGHLGHHDRNREPAGFGSMSTREKVEALGFTEAAARAMAEQEYHSWYEYLKQNGWRCGPKKSDKDRTNPRMVDWFPAARDSDAKLEEKAAQKEQSVQETMDTLCDTLIALRRLGYRSRPDWQRFRRKGKVTATRRDAPWTWKSHTGAEMRAGAGDWEDSDGKGVPWS